MIAQGTSDHNRTTQPFKTYRSHSAAQDLSPATHSLKRYPYHLATLAYAQVAEFLTVLDGDCVAGVGSGGVVGVSLEWLTGWGRA